MWTALLLSRLQFAFTVSFHIIFPSFTIGLAALLTVLEAFHLVTGKPVYRRVFEFWLKIFGATFGLGVVSGIVLAFEFCMNWSRLSEVTGPIQGALLTYESWLLLRIAIVPASTSPSAFLMGPSVHRRRVSSRIPPSTAESNE